MNKLTVNNKLRVAIAGLGFGEAVHLKAIKESKNFIPVALWHPKEDRLKVSTERHKIRGYSSWNSLLNDKNIDAIIIATPPEPRFQLALEALKARKHLLLEKPVSLNHQQVIDLQKIALKERLSVAVNFEYRAVPFFIQTQNMLMQNYIGKPWLIKLDWLMSSRANTNRPWNWYSDIEKGGGVIGALGTHAIDILHWLIGPTETISGMISTSIKERPILKEKKLMPVSSEDICLAQLGLREQTNGELIPAQVTLSSVCKEGRGFWLEIYGSEGTLVLGSSNQKDYVHGFGIWHSKTGERLKSISPEPNLQFSTTWEDGRVAPIQKIHNLWSTSIRNGTPIIPGLSEGLASQKVCDKIYESARSGIMLKI